MQSIANFFVSFFHTYDITTEVVMIILVGMVGLIIQCSKPKVTRMLKILQAGLFFSFLFMVIHICMLGETVKLENHYTLTLFNIYYVLFSLCDVGVLLCLVSYHNFLSYKRRFQRKITLTMCGSFAFVCLTILFIPLFSGRLLDCIGRRFIMSRIYSDAYILCSFLCCILIGIISIQNRKDVSKIVNFGSAIFIPLEIIALVAQIYFHTAYFLCVTFVLPLFIYLVLFHINNYDDITGCQGNAAYITYLRRLIINEKDFIHLTVTCPTMEARNNAEIEHIVINQINRLTRQIERIDNRLRVYSISTFHYEIICTVKDEFEAEYIRNEVIDFLTEPILINDDYIKVAMNFLVSKRYDAIASCVEYLHLLKLKSKNFLNLGIDQTIEVTEEDAKNFKHYAFIEKNILDIKYKRNLDDERVVVFVQPIHDIETGKFKTGECLMRLMIDGKMVYPDVFIPIAEHCGCIHSLTRIMLYKAAKLTTELRKNPDFEALTVNVSTVEMIEPNVCEEFHGIIMRAGAKPENIRLEITESTKVLDYKRVLENINQFVSMGIDFYLDDFGTGYSNLDRVIGMPFRTIKFDKSLMYKALEDKKTEQLIKFLAGFFKSKGFTLVVEGVETEIQREYVTKLGFNYIQGYLFSKPVPAQEVEKFFIS